MLFRSVAKIRSMLKNDVGGKLLSKDLLDILWSTATRIKREISKRLAVGLRNDISGMSPFVPDFRKQFLRDDKRPRKLSWFLTNLGVLDGEPAKTRKVSTIAAEWSICRS